jgi:hypothetical protein
LSNRNASLVFLQLFAGNASAFVFATGYNLSLSLP